MSLSIGVMGAVAAGAPGIITLVAHRFWRITITKWKFNGVDGSASGTDTRIAEWQLHTSDDTEYPTVNMTGATTPAPLVASASDFAPSQVPWHAFDGGLSNFTRWISDTLGGTKWVQIDLGSGNAILPTYCKIAPDNGVSAGSGYWIVDFKIEGSPTGLFAGEQQLFFSTTNLQSGWADFTLRQFNF